MSSQTRETKRVIKRASASPSHAPPRRLVQLMSKLITVRRQTDRHTRMVAQMQPAGRRASSQAKLPGADRGFVWSRRCHPAQEQPYHLRPDLTFDRERARPRPRYGGSPGRHGEGSRRGIGSANSGLGKRMQAASVSVPAARTRKPRPSQTVRGCMHALKLVVVGPRACSDQWSHRAFLARFDRGKERQSKSQS